MAEESKVSFKDTLNLPTTDFPIHPKYAQEDAALLHRWANDDLYRKTFDLNEGEKKFILHDGPPYTNGHIHLGHAYNHILKDIIAKSHRMAGKHVPVTPGFDCHGLPIEQKVTQELAHEALTPPLANVENTNAHGTSKEQLKKACRDYSNRWIKVQSEEFKQLGILMDFDRPYKTMDPEYEAAIVRAFGSFVSQGFIERKHKTVPWCFNCQTVLASAEIEYQDRKDPSIYAQFPLESSAVARIFPDLAGKEVSLLIWTTTPWTLPLNRAVVLSPTADYVVLDVGGKLVVVGAPLADRLCAQLQVEKKIVAQTASSYFTGAKAHHPFVSDLQVPVILDAMVSLEDGTACVHCAPGCGPEDYGLALKNGLEIFSPLSIDGKYTAGVRPDALIGLPITQGQGWVIKRLMELDRLLHKASINHSYPHCWRCHQGLMYRATMQWFCSLERMGLREKALQAIDQTQFVPSRSSGFLRATVSSRLEWCLSRQRVWGVPIPALLCKNGDSAFIDPALIEKVAAGIAKEGIEYWDRVSIDELCPPKLRCTECQSTEFVKEQDILDVWFDSGVSNYAVLKQNPALAFPADVYCEGLDQHRGWFQSSLLCSLVVNHAAPYRTVITHGFTVDEQGRKMSKSLGNVVAPQQIIDQLGTDGLRLWVSSISFEGDVVVSPTLLTNIKEVNRKIRNTCRFILANLYDFKAPQDLLPASQLSYVDRAALHQLQLFEKTIRAAYESYNLNIVFQELGSYCSSELSAFYLDIIKDRLYTERKDGRARRSAQTVCWYILDTLTKLMAPILSFSAELISDHYQTNKDRSIHVQPFAQAPQIPVFDAEQWKFLRDLRAAVLKAIEMVREKGLIKHPLEAQITLHVDATHQAYISFLKDLAHTQQTPEDFFKEWFIVSQVTLTSSATNLNPSSMTGVAVHVEHAAGVKCPRCWQWTDSQRPDHLCTRCEKNIS
jgi:isoleucyl-tRNA synthetase